LRLRAPEQAARVAEFAADDAHAPDLRLNALELLKTWPTPPRLDPVQGAYREMAPVEVPALAATVASALRVVAKDADPALARAAWDAAAALGIATDTTDLMAIVRQDTPLAADALRNLQAAKPAGLAALATTALDSQHASVRAAALLALSQVDRAAALAAGRELALGKDIPVARVALSLHAEADSPVITAAVEALRAGTLPPELSLDVVEAADQA
jgi:hypothetical protein